MSLDDLREQQWFLLGSLRDLDRELAAGDISAEDHAGQKKPVWIIATALVCLAAALWWVLMAF